MRTACKCRAYPDPEQVSVLNRTFGCVRVVWNRTLAWRHARYHDEQARTRLHPGQHLPDGHEGQRRPGLAERGVQRPAPAGDPDQQVAFGNFFAGRARYPRYKSRTGRQSAEYTRSGFRYRDGRLFLAKMSTPLEFAWSWPDIDPASIDPTTVTVSRDPCGRWYISLAVDVADPEQLPATGAVVGGLGIKNVAVTSDGEKIPNPRRLARRERNLARYQRRWPAARRAPRTGPRRRRRLPAPTGRSAPAGQTSCTAPRPGWSATTT